MIQEMLDEFCLKFQHLLQEENTACRLFKRTFPNGLFRSRNSATTLAVVATV